MAEENFLLSQQSRTEKLASDYKDKANDLRLFWSSFNDVVNTWKGGLEKLAIPHLETQKLVVASEIKKFSDELLKLRKACNGGHHRSITFPRDGLPVVEIRSIHKDLSLCKLFLDGIRSKLLPKGKFVFLRYREAMKKTQNVLLTETQPRPTDKQPAEPSVQHAFDSGRTVQDLHHCNVVITAGGQILVDDVSLNREVGGCISSPLMLMNLSHCKITLYSDLPAIHMTNIVHSVFLANGSISGATHITRCRNTKVTLRSQQLRLHESQSMECFVEIWGGVILEESTRVFFYTNQTELDVRDFSWLRASIASPNYSVESYVTIFDARDVDLSSSVPVPFDDIDHKISDIENHRHILTNSSFIPTVEEFGSDDDEI